MLKFHGVLFVLLVLITDQVFSQTSTTDSLHLRLHTAVDDSSKCLLNGELGYFYAQRNYDSSKHYLNKAIAFAESNQFDLLNIRFLCFKAMANTINGELDSAVVAMKKAARIAKEESLDSALAQTHFGLGNVFHAKGDITTSLDYYLKALRYFEEQGQQRGVIRTKGSMSVLYLTLEEYEKAAELIRETNKYHVDNGSITGLMNGYQRLSSIFRAQGNLDSALNVLGQAKEMALNLKDTYSLSIIENSIGGTFFEMEEYDQAALHYKNSIFSQETLGKDSEELISIYARLALCQAIGNRHKESNKYLAMAEERLKRSESIEFQMFFYEMKYKIDSVQGDFFESLKNHQMLTTVKNKLFDIEKSNQLTEMATKYETEKKESQITSLSQQGTIQALEIKQKNTGILIGVVLVVLIAGGIYLVNRQRVLKGTQAQMELEQRFLRSQLNPHFISNALLAVQNFMLKKQPEEAAIYLSKFSKLMRETLENSRQEFILLEDELQMLTHFMDIHKMRMDDAFDYQIHIGNYIDPETDTIPPMFVQPFVENAIEHGISQAKGKGQINLYFEKEGEYISIVVKDNGGGFAQSRPGADDHTSLSSTIIQERMDIFNKTLKRKIQLMLGNIEGEAGEIQGTKVELKVPFSYI